MLGVKSLQVAVIVLLSLFTFVSSAVALDTLPKFSLSDVMSGKKVKSDAFKGKVLLITFFATWCPPCRQEVPSLIKLQKKYKLKNFSVLGFSVDEAGPGVVKKMIEKDKINYPVVMVGNTTLQDFGGVAGLPTTFLFDKKGKFIKRYMGYTSYQKLENDIKSAL